MRAIYWAISDIKRNIKFLTLFLFSFSCALIMLSMIYSQFSNVIMSNKIINNFKKDEVTALNVSYKNQDDLHYTNGVFQLKDMNLKNTYSIINRTGTNNANDTFLYIIGDESIISSFSNKITPQSNDVFIDSKMNEKEVREKLLNEGIQVNRIIELKEDCYVMSKMNLSLLLNDHIVIYQNYDDITLFDFSNDELLYNMIIINGDANMIDKLVENTNKGNEIEISKYDFLKSKQTEMRALEVDSIFYTILFICLMFVFILMMVVNNNIMADMKIGEYSLHLAYGACKKDIYLRVALYNAIVILFGWLLYLLLNMLYQFSEYNLFYTFGLSFFVWLSLVIIPIIKLNKQNLFENMRGDFS